MCGNIWEHVGGIRFMDGQVQVIPDNGAAAGADQSRDSKEWQAIHTAVALSAVSIPTGEGAVLAALVCQRGPLVISQKVPAGPLAFAEPAGSSSSR